MVLLSQGAEPLKEDPLIIRQAEEASWVAKASHRDLGATFAAVQPGLL